MIVKARGPAPQFGKRSTATELARNCFATVSLSHREAWMDDTPIGKGKARIVLHKASPAARREFKRLILAFCPTAEFTR